TSLCVCLPGPEWISPERCKAGWKSRVEGWVDGRVGGVEDSPFGNKAGWMEEQDGSVVECRFAPLSFFQGEGVRLVGHG
nr:hypothetical protein [Armatimonadota bacterium]